MNEDEYRNGKECREYEDFQGCYYSNQFYTTYVNPDGERNYHSVSYDSGCVRPALWINLESEIF